MAHDASYYHKHGAPSDFQSQASYRASQDNTQLPSYANYDPQAQSGEHSYYYENDIERPEPLAADLPTAPSRASKRTSRLSEASTLAPFDSVSNVGSVAGDRSQTVHRFSRADYLVRDPFETTHEAYSHPASLSMYDEADRHMDDNYREEVPLVQNALPSAGYGGYSQSYLPDPYEHTDATQYDAPDDMSKYPPSFQHVRTDSGSEKGIVANVLDPGHERPSIWTRLFRDTTPLDQKIYNRERGIGIQRRPWLCYILSVAFIAALIAEMAENWKVQGTPVSTKPTFNYMLGPSSEMLIHIGARFVPCMKSTSVSSMSFACLNNTLSSPTTVCSLSEICGFGLTESETPDQSFRFILPVFLHAGIVHIIFNLLVQLTSTAQVECEMGSLRFFFLYFTSGIFGFVLGGNFALIGRVSVGASGAIYGAQAAILVDLVSHWSLERHPKRKLFFCLLELVIGFGLGYIPNLIDNFSHIGGFVMGLLCSIILYPAIHQTKRHRIIFYVLRLIALPGILLLFVFLIRNFYTADPNTGCSWCRYLSCWPTKSNDHCTGTGLTTTTTSTSLQYGPLITLALGHLARNVFMA